MQAAAVLALRYLNVSLLLTGTVFRSRVCRRPLLKSVKEGEDDVVRAVEGAP